MPNPQQRLPFPVLVDRVHACWRSLHAAQKNKGSSVLFSAGFRCEGSSHTVRPLAVVAVVVALLWYVVSVRPLTKHSEAESEPGLDGKKGCCGPRFELGLRKGKGKGSGATGSKSSHIIAHVKILITYLQVLSSFLTNLTVDWPESIVNLMQVADPPPLACRQSVPLLVCRGGYHGPTVSAAVCLYPQHWHCQCQSHHRPSCGRGSLA
eukprot:765235-Rhodomonas_salina.2